MSKKWLSVRVEDGKVTATVFCSDEITDSEGAVHTVTCSCPVELDGATVASLVSALSGYDASKAMHRARAKHGAVVEDLIEKRPLIDRLNVSADGTSGVLLTDKRPK